MRRGNEAELHVHTSRGRVDAARHAGHGQQGPDLGREIQPAVVLGIVQGFDAHAIAGDKERLCGAVPHREREHAPQALEQPVATPLLIAVQDDFRIRVGLEAVAE